MSDPMNYDRRGYVFAMARDVMALILIVLAVAGLTWSGFETDWRLGVAILSLAAGGLGVALGMTRT